jgi:hypothetical protein
MTHVIERLAGHALVLGRTKAEGRRRVSALGEALHRVAAFVHDYRDVVEAVDVRPIALLLDDTVEVREASIRVGDAFQRSLELPPAARRAAP